MSIIETDLNWCEVDQLDGIDLIDREKLKIIFPNGEEVTKEIKIVESSYETNDMGAAYIIPCRKAHIESKWKGQPCLIPLAGLEAERIQNVSFYSDQS
jgi:hypothetical protein